MTNVILVVHVLVSIVLIAVVLMQRSEGGALGIGGGGGGGGGLMSARGVAGALVRTTMIFGAIFFATSLVLTTISTRSNDGQTDIERELNEESRAASGLPDTSDTDLFDPNTPLLPEASPSDSSAVESVLADPNAPETVADTEEAASAEDEDVPSDDISDLLSAPEENE